MAALTLDELACLTPSERLALIGVLWDSLTDVEFPVSPAQQAEVERRLSRFDDDRTQAIAWEHLKVDLARRVP